MSEFLKALPEAIENTSRLADTKLRFTLERIFNIWKVRLNNIADVWIYKILFIFLKRIEKSIVMRRSKNSKKSYTPNQNVTMTLQTQQTRVSRHLKVK